MSEDERRRTDEMTMADVSHTHPHTGETFGSVYRRGPAVADGGQDDASDAETMRDVDHTPPHGEGANDVWVRGGTSTDGGVDPGTNGATQKHSAADGDRVHEGGEVADE